MKLRPLDNTVVHCKTKDEYDQLAKLFDDAEWKWCGDRLLSSIPYEQLSEFLECHSRFISWGAESCKNLGKRVLSLAEFLQEQGISEELKAGDLAVDDWVEAVEKVIGHTGEVFVAGNKYQVSQIDDTDLPLRLTYGVDVLDWSWISEDNINKFRKCSPPESKTSTVTSSTAGLLSKHTVYKHPDAEIQLWERNGVIQLKKSGRNVKSKTFTITGDADQWAEIFFQGYLSAI